MQQDAKKVLAMKKLRGDVAVVVGEFNKNVTEGLLSGAKRALKDAGVSEKRIRVYWVAGSFEVAELAMRLAKSKKFFFLVCLGAIIKGETSHDEHLAQAVTNGLLRVSHDTGVPVGLGVITANNIKQAEARSGNNMGNRGYAAAAAALELASITI